MLGDFSLVEAHFLLGLRIAPFSETGNEELWVQRLQLRPTQRRYLSSGQRAHSLCEPDGVLALTQSLFRTLFISLSQFK